MGTIARHEEVIAKRIKAQGIQIESLKVELKNWKEICNGDRRWVMVTKWEEWREEKEKSDRARTQEIKDLVEKNRALERTVEYWKDDMGKGRKG